DGVARLVIPRRAPRTPLVVPDKRSADPGPPYPKGVAWRRLITTSSRHNFSLGLWVPASAGTTAYLWRDPHPRNPSQPGSSAASSTRWRLFHQITDGMLALHCQTGLVTCQSTDRR